MTQAEAEEVILLLTAATGGKPDQTQLDYFSARFTLLDYDIALSTATTGAAIWRFFPSWAEFMEIYRTQEARLRPKTPEPLPPIARGKQIPEWVRRWVAARFLYARFNKEQDLRVFPEQDGFADPNAERMPADAWLEEAKVVTDRDVWTAVRM